MPQPHRMRIFSHPLDGRLWWYIHPTIIAARVRAIVWSRTTDRHALIWVRPLTTDEVQQVKKLQEQSA
ncbi:hypothetical protein [Herbaspirillum chlorophenolicum]|uniref:hypothetical protein n=1 Tax=Herbaspirillum chlorophenolicum TaxID=211589 RepID=UPI00067D05CB|nr:hypothetical protein [Herbaspirillum chlorophenolicum]